MEERKSLLKQQGICFKCCSSIFHMAKNCDQDVKCSECGSVTHTAALHPGPAPWMKEPQFPTSEDHKVSEDVPVESEVSLSLYRGMWRRSTSTLMLQGMSRESIS